MLDKIWASELGRVAALAEGLDLVPRTLGDLEPFLTSVPGNSMTSYGLLCGHQASTWCTYIHADKFKKKEKCRQAVEAHTFNSSTQKAQAGSPL